MHHFLLRRRFFSSCLFFCHSHRHISILLTEQKPWVVFLLFSSWSLLFSCFTQTTNNTQYYHPRTRLLWSWLRPSLRYNWRHSIISDTFIIIQPSLRCTTREQCPWTILVMLAEQAAFSYFGEPQFQTKAWHCPLNLERSPLVTASSNIEKRIQLHWSCEHHGRSRQHNTCIVS